MIEGWILTLTVVVAIASGLVAGVFFAFSTFVMRALARLPAAQGVAAMQSVNVTVVNPLFMLALMGNAVVCAVLLVPTVTHWGEPGAGLVGAGSVCYLTGTMLVTLAYNVPRNDALDARAANGSDTPAYWKRFLREWTAANHVRTLSGLAAATLFTIALVQQ